MMFLLVFDVSGNPVFFKIISQNHCFFSKKVLTLHKKNKNNEGKTLAKPLEREHNTLEVVPDTN